MRQRAAGSLEPLLDSVFWVFAVKLFSHSAKQWPRGWQLYLVLKVFLVYPRT